MSLAVTLNICSALTTAFTPANAGGSSTDFIWGFAGSVKKDAVKKIIYVPRNIIFMGDINKT